MLVNDRLRTRKHVLRSPPSPLLLVDLAYFLAGLSLLLLSLWGASSETQVDPLSVWLLGINSLFSLLGVIFTAKRSYPTLMVGFFFGFIFFGIAPLQQLSVGYDPIYGLIDILRESALICMAYTLSIWLCVAYRSTVLRFPRSTVMSEPIGGNYNPIALAVISAATIGAMLSLYGPYLFTSREVLGQFYSGLGDRSAELALRYFFTPFVVLAPGLGLIIANVNKSSRWIAVFALLTLLGFLINNPLITARYRFSTLSVFILMGLLGWNRARLLLTALVLGTFVSPVLNSFRYERGGEDTREFATFFAHLDYDCLTILCHTIRYVSEQGLSYGYNFLSAFLFFVPRSLWESKGENITKTMFEYLAIYRHFGTDNLSSPLPAEGFYAFGLFGALLVPLAYFVVMTHMERQAAATRRLSAWHLVAAISPMLMMITQRGPFLIGYSEFFGHCFALAVSIGLLKLGSRPTAHSRNRRSQFQATAIPGNSKASEGRT